MSKSKQELVLNAARQTMLLRTRDLESQGIPRAYLSQLHRQGLLERSGRGLYRLPNAEPTENSSLAEAAVRVPRSVVCLLSALRFHELTTQSPFEVWLALDRKARRPVTPSESTPLRIVRFSGAALTSGIEHHLIEGVPVRIYGVAKTVADCFKYRNKIGVDVAIEALRDCRRQRLATADELWRYARVCRVAAVMQPYMESLI